jgi:tRNA (guanine37-N1)-methyltransferase
MRVVVVTLFPEFFDGPLAASVLGRAVAAGLVAVEFVSPRDFATNVHRTVDDTPYGGGAGMVMRAPELAGAIARARELAPGAPVVLMSPQGPRFVQAHARRLAALDGIVLVCGRYEGIDERLVAQHVDAELALGDFVLSGGEPAALAVIDAVVRLLPGALGNVTSAVEESFASERLEYPQFTRPAEFGGAEVPPILTSGDHAKVAKWRRKASLLRTRARRPDLIDARPLDAAETKLLADGRVEVPEWLWERRAMPALDGDGSGD